MRKMTMAGLLALIGLMPEVVLASGLPASVKAAAATLVNLGYTEVAVSFRVFGGYVLQGKLDDTFVMVALAADGTTIVQTELFRDLDGNGVVDSGDIGLVLLDFGPCEGCATDLDGNGVVDSGDLGLVLLDFGPCP